MKKAVSFILAIMLLCTGIAFAEPASSSSQSKVQDGGDYFFYFGEFEQDTFSYGKEPIVWRMLARDEQKGLVLAVTEYGLYTMKYHKNNKQVDWEDTDVHDWLNGTFLASFTGAELSMIAETNIYGSMDRVFLLDADQISTYLRKPYLCYATPYALEHGENGAYVSKDTGGSSWLVRGKTTKKKINFVGGGGSLYTADGSKGSNSQTSDDNVVRPAIWVREEATHNRATDFGFPLYAKTSVDKIATRSGSSNEYNGLGAYPVGIGKVVRVISRAHGGTAEWLQVEFEYKGEIIRCYTGAQRVDVNVNLVPRETYSNIGNVTVKSGVTAYYGPGTQYKKQPSDLTPAGGTVARVIFEENGWYSIEYAGNGEKVRVWVPADAVK